jgi:hypothetical protein
MRVKTNKGGKEGKKETIKVWPSLHWYYNCTQTGT